MKAVAIPYLIRIKSRGRYYFYYRRHGQRVQLPALDSPGFFTAYSQVHAEAESVARGLRTKPGQPALIPGSLAALIAAYRNSDEWRSLAPASRADYDKALIPLETEYGARAVATLPRAAVFKIRDKYSRKTVDGVEVSTPRRANRVVNVLRLLLSWGCDRGWCKINPALRPGRLKTGPGYRAWTAQDFEQFMESTAPEPLKRAAALGYYTGQRKQDCLALRHDGRRNGVIEVFPEKTKNSSGVRLWIPEHPRLSAALDAAPPRSADVLLTRGDGQPWGPDDFNKKFAAAVKRAGLVGLSFHGLRKGASARLAESGATDAEIDSILGHCDPKMTRLYRQQADQKIRAESAMKKLTQRSSVKHSKQRV